ncbi:Outer membrane assembly lipoprotein YfiO [Candidatus Sulfotelmatomonas gaucii]|uniref:Outer membrane assembly lipoprotein YfiO n=1 Tax=Candidatus Sulfuritelmatomonas gaucii TaxID=2043161 RepID=A0A2N9L3Q9_9BACT|nr:Outer membrane assembly lipoprotein YfiO [Candidatus Sulfotelmatomonas gaucii]
MNRLSFKIVVFALFALFLSGGPAQAQDQNAAGNQKTAQNQDDVRAPRYKKKKKKPYDLNANPLAGVQSKQPDKELYDKAMVAMKKGRYDVARLDLQTLLNTYPESEYRMRAKLSVGDTWFKEGGSAALTQAEAEYEDFITFFPNAPEAAEAKMKVADIYYQQMEKPDRDYSNAQQAEKEYRDMINMFPDSTLVPRAKQRLRDVQEVLAEREFQIGSYYLSREDFVASIARLETVADTYPLYSRSDQVLIDIGDAYAGEAHNVLIANGLPGAVRERMHTIYEDKAAEAYDKVITRYPMAPHVEDARDRLVAMNRPVPEPSESAIAESDAEERSRQPLHFTDRTLDIIKRGPTVVEAVHVGEPTLEDPKRTLSTDVSNQNKTIFVNAINAGRPPAPATAVQPTGPNEPPRSDQPSTAPLQMQAPGGGTGVGVEVVSAPNGPAQSDPNALVKSVGPTNNALPAAEKPTEAPLQVNDIKTGENPAQATTETKANGKTKKPKANLGDESSSKKKKKKGLDKLNPF